MDWIKPLHSITLADIPQVGSKAAHLGAMLRAGFPVPDGFVITIDAFIEHFGAQTDPLVRPNVPRLQSELMNQVVNTLVDVLGHEQQLAVRSSASDEDSVHSSFAGQHSTYYFVSPQRLDEAIIDCWMSLWSEAAMAYRRAGWDSVESGQPVRMAVIVQKMLQADRAGVTFSRDPLHTEAKEVVTEACWGLGAAMVDGRVTPDQYRVDENEQITQRRISDKKFQVQVDQGNREGHRLQEVSRTRRQTAVLEDHEITQLANLAAQLETLFEFPQDIEWAFEGETLYLLQSRPISTFPGYHNIQERLVLFKPLIENFTEPLTPMSADLYAQCVPNIGAVYQGRVYLRFDLIDAFNPFEMTDTQLVQAALLRDMGPEYEANLKVKPLRALRTLGLGVAAFLVDGVNWLRTSWLRSEDLGRYKSTVDKVLADPSINAQQTLKRLIWGRHPLEPITNQMLYCNVSAGRYFLLIYLVRKLVGNWLPDYDLNGLSHLFHQSEDIAPMQLITQLNNLSGLLKATLDSEFVSEQETIAQLRAVLADESHTLPPECEFTHQYEAFLNEFGHRGPKEMELATPRWRETPGPLLRLIYASSASEQTDPYAARLLARDELHQQLSPRRRRILDYLAQLVRHYISLRENTRQLHVLAFSATRQKLLEMEQQLIATRRLQIPGDIFFLKFAEAQQLAKGELDVESAQLLVRRRRRRWQHQAAVNPPATINLPQPGHSESDDPSTLIGQCASPGRTRGVARVITGITEHNLLQAGEILVAPYTDPAWTPLFSTAAAVVVETGSYLSHAGTVAREMHVPCVVDVPDCMRRLRSGMLIEVDADQGCVRLLDPDEELLEAAV